MKKQLFKRNKLFSFLLPVLIIALLMGVAVVKWNRDKLVTLKTKTIPEVVAKLVGDPTVKIKEITNLKKVSGVYQFDLNLDFNGTERKFTSYMTRDGKIFFSAGTVISDLGKTPSTTQAQPTPKALTCADVTKAATPKVTAFLVSNCPFGLQMQRVMNKAFGEQPALKQMMDVKYMGAITNGKITSMHGDAEAQENLRQICIRDEQSALYWSYVSCYMKEGKATDCQNQVGVNTQTLNACMTDSKRGLAYAAKDFALSDKLGIGSSPTLVANDTQIVSEFDFGGRTADALKQIACCSGSTQASFCSTSLSKDDVASSFSLTDAAAAGGTAANCGTN